RPADKSGGGLSAHRTRRLISIEDVTRRHDDADARLTGRPCLLLGARVTHVVGGRNGLEGAARVVASYQLDEALLGLEPRLDTGDELRPQRHLRRIAARRGHALRERSHVLGERIGGELARAGHGFLVAAPQRVQVRSEEHTSELQSRGHLVCRLLLEKKKINTRTKISYTRQS